MRPKATERTSTKSSSTYVCMESEKMESELNDQKSILSALPKESHADSMERYFGSLPFDHTLDEPVESVPMPQLPPPLNHVVVSSPDENVATVHTTTKPYTTTTVTTPLIRPAQYAVLINQNIVAGQHSLPQSEMTNMLFSQLQTRPFQTPTSLVASLLLQ